MTLSLPEHVQLFSRFSLNDNTVEADAGVNEVDVDPRMTNMDDAALQKKWNTFLQTVPQNKADSELAGLYATAIGSSQQNERIQDIIHDIPPASTFGAWWGHLHSALKTPEFIDWANRRQIDLSKPMTFYPQWNQVSATIKGQHQTLSATVEGLDWPPVMTAVMRTANVLAAGRAFVTVLPSSRSAPTDHIATFYGEPKFPVPTGELANRLDDIEQHSAFTRMTHTDSNSMLALAAEERTLGDLNDFYTLVSGLTRLYVDTQKTADLLMYRTTLDPDDRLRLSPQKAAELIEDTIDSELESRSMTLDPDSSYSQNNGLAVGATVSLKQWLMANGLDIPGTLQEVHNLVRSLSSVPVQSPRYGNLGGAMSWPIPLGTEEANSIRNALLTNSLGIDELVNYDADQGVLGYIGKNVYTADFNPRNAQATLEALLGSPKAQALGLALQTKFGGVSTADSINDWLLGAIHVTLDSGFAPVPETPARNVVAGFNLARQEHWGQHPSAVVGAFVDHLVKHKKASRRLAPIAAHILLTLKAPAFLVRDIPDKVTYGSHTWVSLVRAVARIEAQAPGATANMTFAEVMMRDSLAPTTPQDRHVEQQAQEAALKDWGVVNGLLTPNAQDDYTAQQMAAVRSEFSARVGKWKAASEVQASEMPWRTEMALSELRRVYGNDIPFTERCLSLVPEQRDYPGPYSVLDLFLNDMIYLNAYDWHSSDDRVPIRHVQGHASKLKNINSAYKAELPKYFNAMEEAIRDSIKKLVVDSPIEDRLDLEGGEFEVFKHTGTLQGVYGPMDTSRIPNDKTLYVKTKRNGVVATYEVDLKNNSITKRTNLGDFSAGRQSFVGYPKYSYTTMERVQPSGTYSPVLKQERTTAGIPDSYASERTRYLADAMVEDVNIRRFETLSMGVTTFESEVPFYKAGREFLLNLIPLRSAIVNFQKGNIEGGLVDLGFDAFGFLLAVGAAAKGAKALQAGTSAVAKATQVAKIVGRGALGALNPLDGVGNLATSIGRGAREAISEGVQSLRQLRRSGSLDNVIPLARRSDIAEGTIRGLNGADDLKVTAQLDEASSNWFHIDKRTGHAFGKPIDFVPETSRLVDSSVAAGSNQNALSRLERFLSTDNAIRFGKMRDFKVVQRDLHTYVDEVGGQTRINIVAHGGIPEGADGALMYFNKTGHNADQVFLLLKAKGIHPSQYDSIRLIMCHSAEGTKPFAERLKELARRPVYAFDGTVTATFEPKSVRTTMLKRAKELEPDDWEDLLATAMSRIEQKVFTSRWQINPFQSKENFSSFFNFNYRPRVFDSNILPKTPPMPLIPPAPPLPPSLFNRRVPAPLPPPLPLAR